ncbi:MAG: exodeoxyribonuclease VII large subunit, partial [Catalinimonas sp.]
MWLHQDAEPTPLTLAELAEQIQEAVYQEFPDDLWVTAEISSLKVNAASGHCYLDLRDDGAHLRGCLWQNNYTRVRERFAKTTGSELQSGQQVMLRAGVRFHPRWGLSLDVRDVNPEFTLGDAARRRHETFARLRREGWTELNRARSLAEVPQRLAVVSSATAEGYHDFRTLLSTHPGGYAFRQTLFPALMQGREAPVSVSAALDAVTARAGCFDAVAVMRGGGSTLDLAC